MALSLRKRMELLNNSNNNNQNDDESLFYDSFRIKEVGKYRLRFLPDKNNEEDYFRQVGMHFFKPAWGSQPVFCPRTSILNYEYDEKHGTSILHPVRKDCPICELFFDLKKSQDLEDQKLADSIKVGYRFIFNVIILDHPTIMNDGKEFKYESDRVYVFNTAPSSIKTGGREKKGGLDQILEEQFEDGTYKYPDIIDYDEGILIDIVRKGKGFSDTSYVVSVPETRNAKYIPDPRDAEEWREKSFDLTEFVSKLVPSEQEIGEYYEKLMNPVESSDDEEEEAPPQPTPNRRKKEYNPEKVEEELLEETTDEELEDLLAELDE